MLGNPDAQHVLDVFDGDADGHIRDRVPHLVAVADLDDNRVQVEDRVELFERAFLPGGDFLQHHVGGLRDRVMGQLGTEGGCQLVGDIPDSHASGVEGDDYFIQTAGAARALRYQCWDECAGTVPRYVQIHVAGDGEYGFREGAVAGVRDESSLLVAFFLAEVVGEIGFEPAFKAGADDLLDEAIFAGSSGFRV